MSPRPIRMAVFATAMLVASSAPARADVVTGYVNLSGGITASFSADISVVQTGTSTADIIIKLTNTSDTGGYLTGFVFNNPESSGANIGKATLSINPNYNMAILGTDKSITSSGQVIGGAVTGNGAPAPNFGLFDLGAAVGGDWTGGGSPQPGIYTGDSATFTFSVTAANGNLNQLDVDAILATLSSTPPGNSNDETSFAVRFRGLDPNDDSAKVTITNRVPVVDGAVPAPPGVVLAGIGLACCLLGRVRRKTGLAQ